MSDARNVFTDGEAYERVMGRWSRVVGEIFLDWLALQKDLRWLDVGCGTGSFTESILQHSEPSAISAIDPAEDQIAYAKSRPSASRVDYRVGDAQNLPFNDGEFDVAAMALVITFVPDRAKAVAEMKRVVRPGGMVATYMWDLPGKATTQQPMIDALEGMGIERHRPPAHQDSRIDLLNGLFDAGELKDVASRSIEIQATFKDFDEYWASQTALTNNIVRPIRDMSPIDVARLKDSLRERLPTDQEGHIAYMARANAVKGRVPE
jgi:SAM-dependent methyltransferase